MQSAKIRSVSHNTNATSNANNKSILNNNINNSSNINISELLGKTLN